MRDAPIPEVNSLRVRVARNGRRWLDLEVVTGRLQSLARDVQSDRTMMHDLKFAIRQLFKSPGFTAAAILSLAFGIGACTSVFSIAHGVLLRSLPVSNPHELRLLRWSGSEARLRSFSGDSVEMGNQLIGDSVAPQTFQSLRELGADLAEIFGFAPVDDAVVRAQTAATSSRGLIVSENFFSGLGARPLLGQLFAPGDVEVPDAAHQVVVSFRFWDKHFGRDLNAIGRTISLNGHDVTIIGVTQPAFPGVRAGDHREFYVLLAPGSPFLHQAVTSAEHWWVRLMARMKPGKTDKQLEAALNVGFARAAGNQMKNPSMLVEAGSKGLAADRDKLRRPLLLMLGAVGVVMLIACFNLAGLSLARSTSREHELAVRAALGSGRWRLIRQSLAESLLLASVGGALGGWISITGKNLIAQMLGEAADRLRYDVSINLTVLGFCIGVSMATAVLAALLPAFKAGRTDPLDALRTRGTLQAPRLRFGRALVAAQIALSLTLLTVASLYLRTVSNLRNIDAGFDMERLLVFQINPSAAGYTNAQLVSYYEQLQDRLIATPGVADATLIMNPLLDNQTWAGGFSFPNPALAPTDNLETHRLVVGERYFSTMNTPIVQGRPLEVSDDANNSKVVVVNEAFAQKYLPTQNPLGQSVSFLRADWQIVGICRSSKYGNLKDPAPPTAYLSFRQLPVNFRTSFAVRTKVPPLALATAVHSAVRKLNPAIPVVRIVTQEQLRDSNIRQERLLAHLCAVLAAMALFLSCIGLYGLMAYNVSRRTGEIAIRMAIGAPPGGILKAFLREAILLTAAGIGVGLPAMLFITRVIRSQLFGVAHYDPLTFTLVGGILLAVALLAAGLPAFRAARVNPMAALRQN